MFNRFKELYVDPHIIHWDYYTNYHKNCNTIGLPGGVYGLVFSETMPKPGQYPSEFETCVYIGKSTGSGEDGHYIDRKTSLNSMVTSYMYKRMTHHHKPLMTGDKTYSKGFTQIIEEYGYGRDVLNGTFTGLPLWLCMLIPPPDLDKERIERWAYVTEQMQLYSFEMMWDKTTLGNMDTQPHKDPNSFSYGRMKDFNEQAEIIERFMV